MSYGAAGALQSAVYQLLVDDPALAGLVGMAVFDEMPEGSMPGTYVSLGVEEVRDASDKSGGIAEHRFVVSIVSDAEGFAVAKAVATAMGRLRCLGITRTTMSMLMCVPVEAASEPPMRATSMVRRVLIPLRPPKRVMDEPSCSQSSSCSK